jgi:hypothetical protein
MCWHFIERSAMNGIMIHILPAFGQDGKLRAGFLG